MNPDLYPTYHGLTAAKPAPAEVSEIPVPESASTLNTTPHLNRARVKRTSLEVAASTRKNGSGKPRFTRVGLTFLERIEAHVRAAIKSEVHQHPGVGKTLL
jgi:hypothetical protein